MRRNSLYALVAVLGLFVASCTSGGTQDAGATTVADTDATATTSKPTDSMATTSPSSGAEQPTLRWATPSDFNACFHPMCFESGHQYMVMQLIFNTLVKRDSDELTVIPDLAESWEISDDATQFTFSLNDAAQWQDGEPVTADDVVFTIDRAIQDQALYTGYPIGNWLAIAGADEVGESGDTPSGLEKIDEHTVQITLGAPNVEFLTALADPAYSILPQHLFETVRGESTTQSPLATEAPIGSGPYRVVTFQPNQFIEFEANDSYFLGTPNIKRMIDVLGVTDDTAPALLQTGELDLVVSMRNSDYDIVNEIDGVTGLEVPGVGAHQVHFRTDNPNLSDVRVRQAIAYGFDRRTAHETVAGGAGTLLNVDPALNQNAPGVEPYEYDPEHAEQLLAEATADGALDPDAEFQLNYYDWDVWPEVALAIQNDLSKVGLTVVLEPGDEAQWAERATSTDMEMSMGCCGSFGVSRDWGSLLWDCTSPGKNAYANCDITDLYERARSTSDEAERDAIYDQIAALQSTEIPSLWLWTTAGVHGVSDDISGAEFYPNSRESFSQIQLWSFDAG